MKKICLILLTVTLLSACSKDDMDRTIFIPDEQDHNLPAYTEWGYNSFGAEYERDYFLASHSIVPCKIVYVSNHLIFSLIGRVSGGYSSGKMTLMFIFPYEKISDYTDLMKLNNQKIDLSNEICTVKLQQDGKEETTLKILEGTLHFKRTQLLSIDDVANRAILSGTFELYFLQNGLPSGITDGRFDMGITKRDFFAY